MVSGERFPSLLGEHLEIELDELVAATGLTVEEVVELVEYGMFQPRGARPIEWRFSAGSITLARRASRLRADFDLDLPALALVAALLERIDALEAELERLSCVLFREP
jgi:chaperone modulatory protein CbpM